MSRKVGKTIVITLSLLVFLLFPKNVFAQVVINEFQLSPSGNQWVELYNNGEDDIDISGWIIDDNGGSSAYFTIPSETILQSKKCISFESSQFNWNTASKDEVKLISSSGVETYSYQKSPGDNISIGRAIDGEGDLVVLSSESRDEYNAGGGSCLAPTPVTTETPTAAPTSTPAVYKAVYKIDTPKDGSGNNLSSVQIYVDGNYIHHEDDEILQFFNGHECYSGVDCSLGIHTISLRKTGYLSWEDSENFYAGQNLEENPVLTTLQTSSPTPSPTQKPVSTPVKTISPSLEPEILGETTDSSIIETETDKTYDNDANQENFSENNKFPLLPVIVIGIGLCFISFSIFSIINNAKKENTKIS